MTLQAIVASKAYTIVYDSNGGSSVSSVTAATLPTTLPIPIKSGYTFDGWYTNSNLTTKAVAGSKLSSNITLYAKWNSTNPSGTAQDTSQSGTISDSQTGSVKTYKITFNTYGGNSIAPITAVSNIPDELPTPTKTGYTFDGWYVDAGQTVKVVYGNSLSGNLTLYAKWIKSSSSDTPTQSSTKPSSSDTPTQSSTKPSSSSTQTQAQVVHQYKVIIQLPTIQMVEMLLIVN